MDFAFGSRVLTDDEKEMAGPLQAIWLRLLAESSRTRAWGARATSSPRKSCQIWARTGTGGRAHLNKGINEEWLSWHFELQGKDQSQGLSSVIIKKFEKS